MKKNGQSQATLNNHDIKIIRDLLAEKIDPLERKVSNIEEDLSRLNRRVVDIERDQRTDAAISRSMREMGIFRSDRSSSPLRGNAFLEEIKDDY